jgi:hypothetical protein
MKAIRLEQPGRFAQVNLEPVSAALQPDEALVRVHRIGVCGTDIHAFRAISRFLLILGSLGMSSASRYWSWADKLVTFEPVSIVRLSPTLIVAPA